MIKKYKETAKNIQNFALHVAMDLFNQEDDLRPLKDRDPAKVHWLRQLIAKEFHIDNKMAEEQLWHDCVKSINMSTNMRHRSSFKKALFK